MYICCVEILTQTASFRHPEFQNFHKSLNLPAPTTIIGLLGAALGLSPLMAQTYFDQHPFKVGIAGSFQGKAMDTWKYNKRTAGMHLYRSSLDGGIIQREYLIHNRFLLALCSEDKHRINELSKALADPVFALTMGNSDSLAFVKTIQLGGELNTSREVKCCMLMGDIIAEVVNQSSMALTFSIYKNSESISYDLPRRFNYSSDYGKRVVSETATYTFIDQEMRINFDVEGVWFKDVFIPVFEL